MPKSKSVTEGEVPLYLLPHAITRHISRIGDSMYRIRVKRTHWHYYNISVRTKPLPKELAPARVTRRVDSGNFLTELRHSTGEPDFGRTA
ncbi:MAG: hypothetical protein WC620_11845 [Methanoregula sp.]|jgi:hypothetical protein